MYHEATFKVRLNHAKNKEDAKELANTIITDIKTYEDSPIVFIENPRLINIEENGIDCSKCKYYSVEEQIIGDRGEGIETRDVEYCTYKKERISSFYIHYCNNYKK